MDQDRTVGTLRDELGLEIERALAIDPAPELKVRVRARIDRERTSNGSWRPWTLVGTGALAAAIVWLFVVNPSEREPTPFVSTPVAESVPAAAPVVEGISPPAPSVVPTARPTGGRARVGSAVITEPEVLISPGEAAALRLWMTNIREGRIGPSAYDEDDVIAAPLEPPDEIGIEPITIEPLARLALLEGERP